MKNRKIAISQLRHWDNYVARLSECVAPPTCGVKLEINLEEEEEEARLR